MRSVLKNWREAAAFLAIGWTALYLVAWFRRTPCDMNPAACLASAALRAGADIVMFRWVDTTLAAGFLAVLAAMTVLLNSSLDREHKRADDSRMRLMALLENIARLRLAIKRLGALVIGNGSEERVEAATAQVEASCAAISQGAPELANLIMYILIEFESPRASNRNRRSLIWAAEFVLSQPERYFVTGRFKLHRLLLIDEARPDLNQLSEHQRARLVDWIDWVN